MISRSITMRFKDQRVSEILGFYLDEFLDMQSHISKLCQLIHYSLKNIGHVRNIDDEICKMLVHSLNGLLQLPALWIAKKKKKRKKNLNCKAAFTPK